MAVGQGVAVAVMTVTPLHMDEGAHETRVIGLVISFHIVGMYFFSPLVGWLVDRLPVVLMVGAAGVILPRCRDGLSHRSGGQPRRVRRSVARRYRLVVRHDLRQCTAHLGVLGIGTPSVQGAADFTMVASGATGGLLSGVIVEASSYHALSHWAAVLALSLVAAALYPVVTTTKPRPAT